MKPRYRLLLLPPLTFLVIFCWVSWCNRFASDDFEFMNKLRDYGWAGSVRWFHEHWNTRWSAIGWMNIVLPVSHAAGTLLWYHLLSLGLITGACYRIIRNIMHIDRSESLLLAGYAVMTFFYCSFSISDVFFWVNTSAMYLYGIIALLFALAELTVQKHSVASYLRLACFGIFVAGAYEPLVFTVMLACIILLTRLIWNHGWNVWRIPFDQKVIILLSALMIGFAISYSGEGHVVRASYLPQTTMAYRCWVWVKACAKMGLLFLPVRLLKAFLLSFPFFIAGTRLGGRPLAIRRLKGILAVYVVLVGIALLPMAFVMSEMGPARAWTQVSLFTMLFAAIVSWQVGTAFRERFSGNNVLGLYAAGMLLFILLSGIPHAMEAHRYARAYDKRMDHLLEQEHAGNSEPVSLPSLPDPGWLKSAEIAPETVHYQNQFLREYLQLHFDPVRESGQPRHPG